MITILVTSLIVATIYALKAILVGMVSLFRRRSGRGMIQMHDSEFDILLRKVNEVLESSRHDRNRLQRLIELLEHLLHCLQPHRVHGFLIQQVNLADPALMGWETLGGRGHFIPYQKGEFTMSTIIGIKAGATGSFTATPLPPGATLPPGTVPVWKSSDLTNAPVVTSSDGLAGSVAVPAGATITTFDLTVSLPDGSAATTVSVPVTSAPTQVTGFDINQVS